MSQLALALDPSPAASWALPEGADSAGPRTGQAPPDGPGLHTGVRTGFEAEGRRIGWEHARHQITPPADHLHPHHPVRQGWEAGRAALAGRALAPTRAARLWLDLRLQAWLRGRAFEELLVTPRFVALIDVRCCPVTGVLLAQAAPGVEGPDDAVVMPLYERAGCAVGNLAVVSRQVAQARAALSLHEMAQTVQRLQQPGAAPHAAGLDLWAWRRLAALTSLVTPQDHASAAARALLVLPPPRVRVLNPVQALQVLLTQVFDAPGYARELTDLGALLPGGPARRAYFLFMSAMLARRLSARGAVPPDQMRAAMEHAWSHPLVLQRWQALATVLTPAQCEHLTRRLAQRRAAGAGRSSWRWMDGQAATDGWALQTQGRAGAEAPMPPVKRRCPAARGRRA